MNTYIDNIVHANFFHTSSIRIHTLLLNNKTYYLVDFAVYDELPGRYDVDNEIVRSNGNILRLYAIENGELITKKLFKTPKELLNEITIDFDGIKR